MHAYRDRDTRRDADEQRQTYGYTQTEIDIDREIWRDTGAQTTVIPGNSFSTLLTEFEAIAERVDTETWNSSFCRV